MRINGRHAEMAWDILMRGVTDLTGLSGNMSDEFIAFMRETILSVPDPIEARILAGQKKYLTGILLNRGDFRPLAA